MMKWRRGETLGVGASGRVSVAVLVDEDHVGLDGDLPSVMAVKSALLHNSRSICREGRFLNRFEGCPYIVRCFGSGTTTEEGGDWYNLFLEYASGGSLFDRIRESGRGGGGLQESEARQYTKSILKGLKCIHRQGFVHCDIKPHNVLLVKRTPMINNPNGKRKRVVEMTEHIAKIADFGFAMKAGKREERSCKVGKGSKLKGTPMYIAPESIRCGEYEAHSDIWALGCTVLHMLTGELPWKCDNTTEKAALLFNIGFREEYVPEIPRNTGLSQEARDFLSKCLVRDPKSRWTADMLLAHPFVSGRDCSSMTPGSSPIKRQRISRVNNNFQPPMAMAMAMAAKDVLVVNNDSLSSQSTAFDLTKPYLLMSRSASHRIVPDYFSKNRAIKQAKKKTMERKEEEEEEEEDKGNEYFESCFRVNAWGRYWGTNPIPRLIIPNSNVAIEIFN